MSFLKILKAETSFDVFDEGIKQKLSGVEVSSQGADWDVFSKILKSEVEFNNLKFDEEITSKIKQVNSSYNSGHWLALQKRLKKEEKVRKHLVTSKAVEILCLFLLLFTLDNSVFVNNNVIYDNNAYADNIEVQSEDVNSIANLDVDQKEVKTIVVDETFYSTDNLPSDLHVAAKKIYAGNNISENIQSVSDQIKLIEVISEKQEGENNNASKKIEAIEGVTLAQKDQRVFNFMNIPRLDMGVSKDVNLNIPSLFGKEKNHKKNLSLDANLFCWFRNK